MHQVQLNTLIKKTFATALALTFISATTSAAMIASPLISRGKNVAASGSASAAILVDGRFGSSGTFTVGANSWVAINIGKGPSKVFLVWNNPNETWSDEIAKEKSCNKGLSCPVSYTIETSADSKDGSDGVWKSVVTVTGNVVSTRGHEVDFAGAVWVKMRVASGGGLLDEIEVFDASNGMDDCWFFPGTSISQMTYKLSSNLENTFAKVVSGKHPQFYPAMVRGGIPCILTDQFAKDISKYLAAAGNCKYWAIEMGTNDAWSGSAYFVPTFTANLQIVIDSCKARGIKPVIAKVLATDPAKMSGGSWQINTAFITAVEDLTKKNSLIEGPDLFTAAKNDPSMLGSDGIHPSTHGAEVIQKLWAEKMDALYNVVPVIGAGKTGRAHCAAEQFTIDSRRGCLVVNVTVPGIVQVYNLNGVLQKQVPTASAESVKFSRPTGCVVVRFVSATGRQTARLAR